MDCEKQMDLRKLSDFIWLDKKSINNDHIMLSGSKQAAIIGFIIPRLRFRWHWNTFGYSYHTPEFFLRFQKLFLRFYTLVFSKKTKISTPNSPNKRGDFVCKSTINIRTLSRYRRFSGPQNITKSRKKDDRTIYFYRSYGTDASRTT